MTTSAFSEAEHPRAGSGRFVEKPNAEPATGLPPQVLSERTAYNEGLWDARSLLDDWNDRGACGDLVAFLDHALRERANEHDGSAPEVAYIHLEPERDDFDDPGYYSSTLYDSNGKEIDSDEVDLFVDSIGWFKGQCVPQEFQPDDVPDGTSPIPGSDLPGYQSWEHVLTLDVAKVRSHDFAADDQRTREAVMFTSIAGMGVDGLEDVVLRHLETQRDQGQG